MGTELKRSKKTGLIVVRDEATIYQAADIKAALSTALEKVDQLTVDVTGITDCDLTFLQLLCSAHRSGMQMKKPAALKIIGRRALDPFFGPAFSHIDCGLRDSNDCLLLPERADE